MPPATANRPASISAWSNTIAPIRLTVKDDGQWDDSAKSDHRGLGLHIMGYRAGILGGKLSVSPQPGGGTLMLCEIPLRSD